MMQTANRTGVFMSKLPPPTRFEQSILVAEDDPAEQCLLRRAVRKAGFEVELDFVFDGWGVLNFLQSRSQGNLPALLLLDIRMPGLDGFEVLEALRGRPDLRPAYV